MKVRLELDRRALARPRPSHSRSALRSTGLAQAHFKVVQAGHGRQQPLLRRVPQPAAGLGVLGRVPAVARLARGKLRRLGPGGVGVSEGFGIDDTGLCGVVASFGHGGGETLRVTEAPRTWKTDRRGQKDRQIYDLRFDCNSRWSRAPVSLPPRWSCCSASPVRVLLANRFSLRISPPGEGWFVQPRPSSRVHSSIGT